MIRKIKGAHLRQGRRAHRTGRHLALAALFLCCSSPEHPPSTCPLDTVGSVRTSTDSVNSWPFAARGMVKTHGDSPLSRYPSLPGTKSFPEKGTLGIQNPGKFQMMLNIWSQWYQNNCRELCPCLNATQEPPRTIAQFGSIVRSVVSACNS